MIKWIKKRLLKFLRGDIEEIVAHAVSDAYGPLVRRIDSVRDQLANAVEVGVDLHYVRPERTTIWIMTRFGEGRIAQVDVACHSVKEYADLVSSIREQYGHGRTYVDAVPSTAMEFVRRVDGRL